MSQIVIMPGGFHPFHAGHASLYQSALKAFPNAEVYVAATNDTKTRPFPFEIKEKLARVAGVEPGHFIQVKSPFQAREITQNYNPEEDIVIFVRSEKDKTEQPQPGGTKKDGSPAYFQPYTGKDMQPFGKHAYIAYLPTVEFGPGIKSATEIRNIWPQLNDRRKLAMVMSLYPAAKENQRLAQNIVKMLDMGMGTEEVSEGMFDRFKKKPTRDDFIRQKLAQMSTEELRSQLRDYKQSIPSARLSGSLVGGAVSDYANAIQVELDKRAFNDFSTKNPNWDNGMKIDEVASRTYSSRMANIIDEIGGGYFLGDDSYDDDEGFVKEGYAVYYQEGPDEYRFVGHVNVTPYRPKKEDIEREVSKLIANDRMNISEEKSGIEQAQDDPEIRSILSYAKQHYPEEPDLQSAFVKFVLRSLKHSKEDDERQDVEIDYVQGKLKSLSRDIENLAKSSPNQVTESAFDWSEYRFVEDMDARIDIVAAYFTSKMNLTESNDPDMADYFTSLASMSDNVAINKKCILVPLVLVNNKVSQTQFPEVVKLLKIDNGIYTVKRPSGVVDTYPKKNDRGNISFITVVFNKLASYNKFRTAIMLKFESPLPDPSLFMDTKVDTQKTDKLDESQDYLEEK